MTATLAPADHTVAFVDALQPHARQQYAGSFEIEPGKRYDKVISVSTYGSRSVHAFIDRETGDLFKPAGWKAPAKGARGNVATAESRAAVIARASISSRYLYAR